MKIKNPIVRFGIFTAVSFGPALLLYVIFSVGLLVNALIVLDSGLFDVSISEVGSLAIIFLLPIVLIPIGYWVYRRFNSWVGRTLILYPIRLFLAFGLSYLFMSAVAGTSMAVVDGAVVESELRNQIIYQTILTLFPVQILLVPWSILSTFLIKKFNLVFDKDQLK